MAPGYDEELDIAEISAAGGSGGAVAAAAMGAAARGGASGGGNKYRDAAASLGSHEDEFTVNARDIELGPEAGGRGGRVPASAADLDEEDDDDNDLGRPNARRV